MEALAALGVAGNTVQFLDFATKLCVTSIEIYRDVDGASASNVQSESLLESFIETIDEISSNLGQYRAALEVTSTQAGRRGEAQISSITNDCKVIADDLLLRFENLKSSGKPGKWKSFVSGVKCMWKKKELEELQSRLKQNREELEWRVLLSLRESLILLTSRQEDQFQLQSAMTAKLTEVIRKEISTLPRWPQSIEEMQQELRTNSIAVTASRYRQPEKSALRNTQMHTSSGPHPGPESFADEYATDCANRLAESEEKQWRSLWFPTIDDREEQITPAELKTFDWILQAPQGKERKWDSFIEWLECERAIYWINGKAGSGKSTLMKYLKHHERIQETLKLWADGSPMIFASFFFWYNGNSLQKSQEGLLRSLLWQSLEGHRELIPIVMPEATTQPIIDLDFWTLPRLKHAFKSLLEQREVPLKICLLVDGLDEYAGDHNEIAEVFRYAADLDHVKVCVSSRPLLMFDRAFKDFPGLMLQNMTFEDIKTYVTRKFNDDERFNELEVEEPGLGPNLALQVVSKASGVFLWVKLVVHSLLEGIQNYDRGVDLERRLNELPEDLNDLYWHILDRVKPTWYLEEGFRLMLLVHAAVMPLTLLQLAFAELDTQTRREAVGDMSLERQNVICKSMAGRIKSRCLGLLEVTDFNCKDSKFRRVQFLHKSCKDFIETPTMMCRIKEYLSAKQAFLPEISIIQALGIEIKTVKSRFVKGQLKSSTGLTRRAWFDEVRPIALEAVCYSRIADSKYPKSRSTYTALIEEINEACTDLWVSVSFRSPEEIIGVVPWYAASRVLGSTLGSDDPHDVGPRISLTSQDLAEALKYINAKEGRTNTVILDD